MRVRHNNIPRTSPQTYDTLGFTRGTIFRHGRLLDTEWKPGPGEKYADAPKAVCRVTNVRRGQVFFGIGADATKGTRVASPANLLTDGAEVIS